LIEAPICVHCRLLVTTIRPQNPLNSAPASVMASRLIAVAEEEDAAILKFPKEFDNAETLTISEVLKILENRKEQSDKSDPDQSQKLNEAFVKTLEHCKTFNRLGDNKERIHAVRRMLQTKKLHKFELAQLANLCPDSAEEARTFIPSLENNFQDEELTEILNAMCSL